MTGSHDYRCFLPDLAGFATDHKHGTQRSPLESTSPLVKDLCNRLYMSFQAVFDKTIDPAPAFRYKGAPLPNLKGSVSALPLAPTGRERGRLKLGFARLEGATQAPHERRGRRKPLLSERWPSGLRRTPGKRVCG